MTSEEQIREWQQNVLNDYCKVCSDTCCNPQKHRIVVDSYSVPLFKEKGIPFVRNREIDKSSLRNWKRNKNSPLLFRNGSEIKKPSVVEIPQGIFGAENYLYANLCPLYRDNKCEVHEDPRRPEVCKKYPMLFLGCTDPEGKKLDVKIMDSCECFKNKKVRSLLTERFPVRIVND